MLIDPKQKLRDKFFYNNLLLILGIFVVLCIVTSLVIESASIKRQSYSFPSDGQVFGPIIVKNKPLIYEFSTNFQGYDSSAYVSGEVLDEEKDTLYEFGKDLWHESGYEGGEYYSESDRKMKSKITFTEPGIYYIKMSIENGNKSHINTSIAQMSGSGIPHFMLGCYVLLLIMIVFPLVNTAWVREKLIQLNDKLEEMSDD